MGISYRHYLFPEDGSLKRIPQRIADALPFGRDAIPDYAGTTQRVAQVIVELEDAKPVRILDARGFLWEFDDKAGSTRTCTGASPIAWTFSARFRPSGAAPSSISCRS